MNSTARERLLMIFLPALCVVVGYGVIAFSSQQRKMRGAREAFENAERQAAGWSQLTVEEGRRAEASRTAEDAKKALDSARSKRDKILGRGNRGRPERIERLNRILLNAGLTVIDESDLEGSDKAFPNVEAQAKRLGELTEDARPRPRRIRLAGGYSDVLNALTETASGDFMAAPIGLLMTEGDTSVREWTLLLWI